MNLTRIFFPRCFSCYSYPPLPYNLPSLPSSLLPHHMLGLKIFHRLCKWMVIIHSNWIQCVSNESRFKLLLLSTHWLNPCCVRDWIKLHTLALQVSQATALHPNRNAATGTCWYATRSWSEKHSISYERKKIYSSLTYCSMLRNTEKFIWRWATTGSSQGLNSLLNTRTLYWSSHKWSLSPNWMSCGF